jgi:transcription antitermination factor NusG
MEERRAIESGWHILRCQPAMEIKACEGLTDRGFEAYCPVEYQLTATNRVENGRRVRELRPRALITGYMFLQLDRDEWDARRGHEVRGVGKFLMINGRSAGLTHAEVARLRVVDAEEFAKYQRDVAKRAAEAAAKASGKPQVEFEQGKTVRVDGPTGEPWIATMLQERGARRIQVMVNNAKIIVEHYRVHEMEGVA